MIKLLPISCQKEKGEKENPSPLTTKTLYYDIRYENLLRKLQFYQHRDLQAGCLHTH